MDCSVYNDFDWYYDMDDYYPPTLDSGEVFKRLAQRIADELYEKLHDDMLRYAKEKESTYFIDNPTVWEQMKYDASQGDPFWHESDLECQCYQLMKNMTYSEICLLWFSQFRSENPPEEADMKDEIWQHLMNQLYNEADKAHQEDEEKFCSEDSDDDYYEDDEQDTAPVIEYPEEDCKNFINKLFNQLAAVNSDDMSAAIQKAIDGEAMRISGISAEDVAGYKYLDDDDAEKQHWEAIRSVIKNSVIQEIDSCDEN